MRVGLRILALVPIVLLLLGVVGLLIVGSSGVMDWDGVFTFVSLLLILIVIYCFVVLL